MAEQLGISFAVKSDELFVLQRAVEILNDRNNWCQRWFAVNDEGSFVKSNDPKACKFCTIGAMRRAVNDSSPEYVIKAIKTFKYANKIENIALWNDAPERTHQDVINAFKKAIASIENV